MKPKYRQVIKPSRRSDYAKILSAAWREGWLERYGFTKSDVWTMSLRSLRSYYKQIQKDNFIIAGGICFKQAKSVEKEMKDKIYLTNGKEKTQKLKSIQTHKGNVPKAKYIHHYKERIKPIDNELKIANKILKMKQWPINELDK